MGAVFQKWQRSRQIRVKNVYSPTNVVLKVGLTQKILPELGQEGRFNIDIITKNRSGGYD